MPSIASRALGRFIQRACNERDAIESAWRCDAADESHQRAVEKWKAGEASEHEGEGAQFPTGALARTLGELYPSKGRCEIRHRFNVARLLLPTHKEELRDADKAHKALIQWARVAASSKGPQGDWDRVRHGNAFGELTEVHAALGELDSPTAGNHVVEHENVEVGEHKPFPATTTERVCWSDDLRRLVAELRAKFAEVTSATPKDALVRLSCYFTAAAGRCLRAALEAGDIDKFPELLAIARSSPTHPVAEKADQSLFVLLEQQGLPKEPPDPLAVNLSGGPDRLWFLKHYARQAERLIEQLSPTKADADNGNSERFPGNESVPPGSAENRSRKTRPTSAPKKRGRPVDTDVDADRRLGEAMATGEYSTYADLAREKGIEPRQVKLAVGRHAKRVRRNPRRTNSRRKS